MFASHLCCVWVFCLCWIENWQDKEITSHKQQWPDFLIYKYLLQLFLRDPEMFHKDKILPASSGSSLNREPSLQLGAQETSKTQCTSKSHQLPLLSEKRQDLCGTKSYQFCLVKLLHLVVAEWDTILGHYQILVESGVMSSKEEAVWEIIDRTGIIWLSFFEVFVGSFGVFITFSGIWETVISPTTSVINVCSCCIRVMYFFLSVSILSFCRSHWTASGSHDPLLHLLDCLQFPLNSLHLLVVNQTNSLFWESLYWTFYAGTIGKMLLSEQNLLLANKN